MKIGIITRHLDLPVGFGSYARNLLSALAAAAPEHEYFVYTPRPPRTKLPKGFVNRPADVPERRSKLVWWEHWDAPRAAVRDGVDLIHYLNLAGPLPLTRRPVITNVLDAIQWAEPGYRLPRHYDALARRDVRVASHIITISHAAKIDLNRLLGVSLDKISVTQLAPNETPAAGGRGRLRDKRTAAVTSFIKRGKFWLFVGGTEKRKNLRAVIEAYAQGDFPQRLAVVGPTDPSPVHDSKSELLALLTPAQRRRVKFLGRVSDADLNRLYAKALALVFPTRYEGFGLPALEAMKHGTPVVTSDVSSLPEVVGEAALTVDPTDPNALADAMSRLAADAKLWARLVRLGTKNLKRFSWERTARETLAVYEKMVRP